MLHLLFKNSLIRLCPLLLSLLRDYAALGRTIFCLDMNIMKLQALADEEPSVIADAVAFLSRITCTHQLRKPALLAATAKASTCHLSVVLSCLFKFRPHAKDSG